MEAEPATQSNASKLEAILSALSATDRSLVEARFTEMMAAVDDANAAKLSAEQSLGNLKALKETDKTLMKQHFDQLASLLPEKIREQFLVNTDMRNILEKAEPEVFHNVNQLIKCASAGFMAMSSDAPQQAAKRSRVEPTAVVEEEHAPEPAPPQASILARALADTFAN
ncbi:MAG: hypothetical protein CMO80_14050 [Verrucomicrobiales bacterium]|nr:hypothetical protein [Verrucomicrobiales bacterium]